jgi:hypothetical protein
MKKSSQQLRKWHKRMDQSEGKQLLLTLMSGQFDTKGLVCVRRALKRNQAPFAKSNECIDRLPAKTRPQGRTGKYPQKLKP